MAISPSIWWNPAVVAAQPERANLLVAVGAREEMEKIDPELADSPFIFPSPDYIEKSNIQGFRALEPEQDAEYGEKLHDRDPNLCCAMRKVEPLNRALAGYDLWFTGVRRDEAPTRTNTPLVGWDEAHGMVKVNPVAPWSFDDLVGYATDHDVPVNLLLQNGYPSIGCRPCTRPVAPGEDPRAGRWAGTAKTECGIHV